MRLLFCLASQMSSSGMSASAATVMSARRAASAAGSSGRLLRMQCSSLFQFQWALRISFTLMGSETSPMRFSDVNTLQLR